VSPKVRHAQVFAPTSRHFFFGLGLGLDRLGFGGVLSINVAAFSMRHTKLRRISASVMRTNELTRICPSRVPNTSSSAGDV
jgi:hypothetical protein